jgi:hypothetical protein
VDDHCCCRDLTVVCRCPKVSTQEAQLEQIAGTALAERRLLLPKATAHRLHFGQAAQAARSTRGLFVS